MMVHFICRGNVLRSVIAEAYLNSLKLAGITAMSSGSVADKYRESNIEMGYLANTQELLARHGLGAYAKTEPDQLTQGRLNDAQLAVCLNRVVFDDVEDMPELPANTVYWNIVDIGEGHRQVDAHTPRLSYEEEIFTEITANVDALVKTL